MKNKFSGVITALVTPFTDQGELDLKSFRRLVRAQLQQGVHGFVVNGTTAESPTLTSGEVKLLFEATREESAGQVPILVGTGSNSTAATVAFTQAVSEWNPDGVLVVVPYYNRPPQRGLQLHFEAVARASGVPVVLYNVPGRTVASLDPVTAGSLSRVANIVGLKDATGNMETLKQLREFCVPQFTLLSGDDGTCVDFAARGGHGVIGVASHIIGDAMSDCIRLAQAGDAKVVRAFDERYAPLIKALYREANPIPIKAALYFMGLIDSPMMRLPLVSLDTQYHGELKTCLKALGKI